MRQNFWQIMIIASIATITFWFNFYCTIMVIGFDDWGSKMLPLLAAVAFNFVAAYALTRLRWNL